MNENSVTIPLSVATLIVVGAASFAAIVQLRHLRTSNQLNALLEIMNQWNLPAVQDALSQVRRIPEKMNDPQYVQTLKAPGSVDRAHYREFLAMDLWEQIGSYAKRGLIEEDTLLDVTSGQITNAWKCAEPAIAVLRDRMGLSAYENFEYLAVKAALFIRRYPDGTYPSRLPRMSDL